MSFAQDKAMEVAGYMEESTDGPVPKPVAFALTTILMIVSIILSAIQIWQKCGKNPTVARDALSDESSSALNRGQLRRLIREKARDVPHAERHEFRMSMQNAIHKMGSKLTVEDMEKLFAEAEEESKKAKA